MREHLPRPYTLKEAAELLGLTPYRLRQVYRRMHEADGLPLPISSIGHPKWERSGFKTWLLRNHPFAPALPANDLLPRPVEVPSVAEEQAELALEYAGSHPLTIGTAAREPDSCAQN
jgi:hypothetical protein